MDPERTKSEGRWLIARILRHRHALRQTSAETNIEAATSTEGCVRHSSRVYASETYCWSMRCAVKYAPLIAIVERITRP